MCPEHGGKLALAAHTYGISQHEWIDLSTGLSPLPYLVPSIPPQSWHRLPDDDGTLQNAAAEYYGTSHLLPVAGSQAAIQLLPRLRRAASCVAIVHPTYNEHQFWWQQEGHLVQLVSQKDLLSAAAEFDVVVVANPNNPDGCLYFADQLLDAHARLEKRGGWLIADEAFIDTQPEFSVIPAAATRAGLIVLRSVGKFFGLAGARVGFVAAEERLLESLKALIGPWTITGPAAHVTIMAMRDRQFQDNARAYLREASLRLQQILSGSRLEVVGQTHFFVTIYSERAQSIYESLARTAILTRLFSEQNWLRFGVPGSEPEWSRLTAALSEICATAGAHT